MNRHRGTCAPAPRIASCAISWALALLASMLIVAGASAATPSITEYPLAGSANPDLIAPGLASDPAASVWVTDPYGGATAEGTIYRVDAGTGGVSGTFAPPTGAVTPSVINQRPRRESVDLR